VWIHEGKDKGKLGYPVTERYSVPAPGGLAQDFKNGVIVQTNRQIAILTGAIGQKYFKVGGYTSSLGFPAGPEKDPTGLERAALPTPLRRAASSGLRRTVRSSPRALSVQHG
jgi:uncharacterized protein with LGFP repeats